MNAFHLIRTHTSLQFARCSVEGLSYPMFILAVLGNVTYGLGIFLYSVDPIFLLRKLPWIVGSVGTLFFDFTVSLSLNCCRGVPVGMGQRVVAMGAMVTRLKNLPF